MAQGIFKIYGIRERLRSEEEIGNNQNNVLHLTFQEKLYLGLLMLVVVSISFFFLSHQSLRLDEAQSLWQSARSPGGIIYIIAQDVHVPFYLVLLHFWQFIFGNGVVISRVLSLLFFLGSIPLIFIVGKVAYDKRVAWFSTALLAISPFLNWFGNEIRMYSLLLFLSLLSHFYFLLLYKFPEADRKQRGLWWLGFSITAVFGIYTHYFFWLILLSQCIFYFIFRRDFVRGTFLRLSLIAAFLLVAISPWLYYVFGIIRFISNSQPLLIKPTMIDLFNAFSQFLFGFQNDHINTLIVSLWPVTVILGFLAIKKNAKIPAESVYFLLVTFFPLLVTFFASLIARPLFLPRYLIFSTPTLYLLLGSVLTSYSKKFSLFLRLSVIAGMIVMLTVQIYRADAPVKEDYKDAANFLMQNAKPEDVVFISAPFTVYPIEYYYKGHTHLYTLPIWDRFIYGPIPAFSQDRLKNDVGSVQYSHEKAYVILSYDQGYELQIKEYMDSNFPKIDEKNFSPKLNLYVYDLKGFTEENQQQ